MKLPRLEVFNKGELYEVHYSSLDLLREVGVQVDHELALKRLKDIGADVDLKERRARIPEELVVEAVRKAPSSFNYYGRGRRIRIGGDEVHFLDGGSPLKVLDLDGNYREAKLKDLADLTRLYDALDSIDLITGSVHPRDVPDEIIGPLCFLVKVENTVKPVAGGGYHLGEGAALDVIELASVIAGGLDDLRRRPIVMGWENPLSPLAHIKEQVGSLMKFSELGLPAVVASAPQSGATSPVTLAGTVVQANAENLSSYVIALASSEPGRMPPLIYGVAPAIIDMRRGSMVYSGPEGPLMNVAMAQLAKFYSLPSRGTAGCTESKALDFQAGFESAFSLFIAASSRVNLIMNASGGALGPGIDAMSYVKAVMDSEIVGYVKRALDGIEVNERTVALDVIKKVGPLGHFLAEKHTLELLEREHYLPRFVDRTATESWLREMRELKEDVKEKTKKLLREHQPEPLDPDLKRSIDERLSEIKRRRGLEK